MNNSNIKVGHYTGDGGLVNLPIGFIPDKFELTALGADTAIVFYEWYRLQEQDEASGKQEGYSVTEGVTANLADDAGIRAFNAGSEGPTITEWSTSVATAATARTATAPGTYVKGTTSGTDDGGGSVDRGSIFECVTAGTGGSTEPIWPVADGEQVVDNSVRWEKVNVSKQRSGYQGVIIEDDIQTDGIEYYYTALQACQAVDHGDVDGWTSGIDPNA